MIAECLVGFRDSDLGGEPTAVEDLTSYGSDAAWVTKSSHELQEIVDLARAAPIGMSVPAERKLPLQEARAATLRGDPDPRWDDAISSLRALGEPHWLATGLLEQAEWLVDQGRSDEAAPLLGEARETFERLRATPSLARIDAIAERVGTATA